MEPFNISDEHAAAVKVTVLSSQNRVFIILHVLHVFLLHVLNATSHRLPSR